MRNFSSMEKDKYSAVWVSYSSIRDFQQCPRSYFLRNVYRDPDTNHKITIMSPPLALGQAVHEVVESLSIIPVETRFKKSLIERLDAAWKKVSGEKGGFSGDDAEQAYRNRAEHMLRRLMEHPGPLKNLAVKITMDLPHFYLSEVDPTTVSARGGQAGQDIILCGKIDWLEYFPDTDSVHIIDFKTSKNDEDGDSLQLPIYLLLVSNTQKRNIAKASYWYIERKDEPTEVPIPDLEESKERVLKVAKDIYLARKLNRFKCLYGSGCRYCRPYEAIIEKRAKLVGINDFGQDIYVVDSSLMEKGEESRIL
ncbi:PD-(D/E)XK nuclease family protein [Candidatus Roizmanbacteria bacterium]|nr:PD-(D/E)XK nuclease family protein [Candidatus Roizmanbacteria bacterium]